jgi:hypothetical protein
VQGFFGCRTPNPELFEVTLKVIPDGCPVTADVSADGAGLVSQAGSASPAHVADKSGLTRALSPGLCSGSGRDVRVRRRVPVGPRRAAGSVAACGQIASDSTAYRVIERVAENPVLLDGQRVKLGSGARWLMPSPLQKNPA